MASSVKGIARKMLKKIYNNYDRIITDICAPFRRFFLKNKNFTIISNNCLAGFIYRRYGLPYLTPTVGLFFMAEDFIKFVVGIEKYLNIDLQFITPKESKYVDYLGKKKNWGTYPIGILGDIEIHFLHYESNEDAYNKWTRRVKRVDRDNMLIKFCEQNKCEYIHLKAFDRLKHPYKFCFATKEYPELKSVTLLKADKGQPHIRWYNEYKYYNKYFNITKLLNSMKQRDLPISNNSNRGLLNEPKNEKA